MLSLLNSLCHGYVATPVIAALKKQGFFKTLSFNNPTRLSVLLKTLGGNKGTLKIALHLLESLSWVSQSPKGCYQLTAKAEFFKTIPEDIVELYRFKIDDTLIGHEEYQKQLSRWVGYLLKQDHSSESFQLLQGAILVPLLMTLRQKSETSEQEVYSHFLNKELKEPLRRDLYSLLRGLGWLKRVNADFVLTELGEAIIKRAYVMGIAASYRPMLFGMHEMLFGHFSQVFTSNSKGEESHIDRRMNVIASGTQHGRYFEDAQRQILGLFDEKVPMEKQPKYIADMGCGDGTFLKQIYTSLQEKTRRGQQLKEHPIILIGIDCNEAALKETAKTLEGLPHLILKGDINDPQQLLRDLKGLGIKDVENIVHVRTFLDHNFRCDASAIERKKGKEITQVMTPSGVYVDSLGEWLSPEKIIKGWKKHLQSWGTALKNNPYGLFVVEAHCLDTQMTGRYFEQSENFYFDALHAFSGQYLLDAEIFIILAANAGLFAKTQPRTYPKILPFCRVTLNHFEKRNYQVRHAQAEDLAALQHLEEHCWVKELQTPRKDLSKRLSDYPEGQFVVDFEGKVVGVIYSQRIADKEELQGRNAQNVSSLHKAKGSVVQLLAVNIDPKVQERQIGDQLLEFMLQRCSVMPGINSVVGITLCRDYHKQKALPMQKYMDKRDEQGHLFDPILRFHELHGAKVTDLIDQYRPGDTKNEGFGVLVEYDIHNRARKEVNVRRKQLTKREESLKGQKEEGAEKKEKSPLADEVFCKEEVEGFLEELVKKLLGEDERENFSKERPLMEMGLDSADLLELSEQMPAGPV